MKCFCCGKDMKEAKVVWCPDCGLTIDMKTRKATVLPKESNKHVSDSYACMDAIHKYKPDIVLANCQLFESTFNLSDVKFFYKNKLTLSSYEIPEDVIPSFNVIHSNYEKHVEASSVIIAIDGVLSYRFRQMLLVTCKILENWKGVPVISLYNVDTMRYMWQMAGNLTLPLPEDSTDGKTFVDMVTRYRLGKSTGTVCDNIALIAYKTNGVAEFLSNINFTLSSADSIETLLKDRTKEALIASGSEWTSDTDDKLLESLKNLYALTRPCTAQVKGVLFDPMSENYTDTRYKNVTGSSSYYLINWWEFLARLYSVYFYPDTVSTEGQLRQSYTDWVNE